MVKKVNDKWRMCPDYTNLNRACPKDTYPLPSIDRLVDGASGFQVLNFLGAYSGYNQIKMHPPDEEKRHLSLKMPTFVIWSCLLASKTQVRHTNDWWTESSNKRLDKKSRYIWMTWLSCLKAYPNTWRTWKKSSRNFANMTCASTLKNALSR